MQVATTLSFHLIPIRRAAITTNDGKEVEWGNPYTLLLEIGADTMRFVWKFFRKSNRTI